MKLKVQHVMDATLVISQIIREKRPMPQRGKFFLARLHAKLEPEYQVIAAQRDALIMGYNARPEPTMVTDPATGEVTVTQSDQWMVPSDKMEEFTAAWGEVARQEIEVDVQPVSLADLDLGSVDGSLSAVELITLGELVAG